MYFINNLGECTHLLALSEICEILTDKVYYIMYKFS